LEKSRTTKQKQTNLKSPTINILLNISLFFLSAIIVYMSYSLYVKLSYKSTKFDDEIVEGKVSELIQVDVRNGCGVSGVADRYTDFLRSKGFDVADYGNYISSEVDETLVIDRMGNMANAYEVAKALGVKKQNIIQQLNKDYFIDVSVIIGKDYLTLNPFK
jgi:hypothetical protein